MSNRRSLIVRPEMLLPDGLRQVAERRRIRQLVDNINTHIQQLQAENAALKEENAALLEAGETAIATSVVAVVAWWKIIPTLSDQLKREREAVQQLVDRLDIWHAELINAVGLVRSGQGHRGRKLAMAATQAVLSYPIAVESHKDDWLVPHLFRDEAVAHEEGERGQLSEKVFAPDKPKTSHNNRPLAQVCYRAWALRTVWELTSSELAGHRLSVRKAIGKVVEAVAWIDGNQKLAAKLGGSLSFYDVRYEFRQAGKHPNQPVPTFARGIAYPSQVNDRVAWFLDQLASEDGEAFALTRD